MRQSTLLVSRQLINSYILLQKMTKKDLRDLLSHLLKDPLLWEKMRQLKSEKYTKTYQEDGLDLVPLKFYPFPEDWCVLSALSNGSGFSRCFIFVYLLEFYLGKRKMILKVTNQTKLHINKPHTVLCRVKVSKTKHYLERQLRPKQKTPKITPIVNRITLVV